MSVCDGENVTYWHRVDDPGAYNFCPVNNGYTDVFLFASVAIVIASTLHFSRISAVLILFMGCAAEILVYNFNLGRFGNSFTLWLGSSPDLLLYGFLPPLLLDAAMSLDWFVFTKVARHAIVYAFFVVIATAICMTPCMLYGLRLIHHGWNWSWAALFVSTLASTDALAVSAIIKGASGPEHLTCLMEGESLLNDATSLVLFSVLTVVCKSDGATEFASVLPDIAVKFVWLAGGGCIVGLLFGYVTLRILRILRRTGASHPREIGLIQAMAFFTYYIGASPLNVSGVIAVVVFGLYGSATSKFELANSDAASQLDGVQNTIGSALNGIVFFLAGATSTNFLVRAAPLLEDDFFITLWYIPVIYVLVFAFRLMSITVFNSILGMLGLGSLPMSSIPFITLGGLRGALSLIMAMEITFESALNPASSESLKKITAQIVTWTSSFVLLTLIINAPSLPWMLRVSGLLEKSASKKKIMAKVHKMLAEKTTQIVEDLKADEDEMFRGVDWSVVTASANENIGLTCAQKVTSGSWPVESLSSLKRALSRRLQLGSGVIQEQDIEEPLIADREGGNLNVITDDGPSKHNEGVLTAEKREIPFASNTLGKTEEHDAENSSWNTKTASNVSTGWSSPVQNLQPMPGDLQGWWGASIRQDDGSNNDAAPHPNFVEGLVEARTRLMWGIKRYIYSKRQEGLLSPSGARILAYACDSAIEDSGSSLDIWTSVNKEIADRIDIQAAAWIFHSSRMMIYSSPASIQPILEKITKWSTSWLGIFLGKAMLQSCEVAIAYHMALCHAKQSKWLEMNHRESILYSEVQSEKTKVYKFIIDRELEAPAHFEAMQTYRASMAVIKRQLAYIESIYDAGMISENEKEHITSSIQRKKKVLEVLGPTGTKWQSSANFLLSLPIFKSLEDSVVREILSHGALQEFGDGDVIWKDGSNNNPDYAFCVVIRGLVCIVSTSQDGHREEIEYRGSGTMLGILPALTMSQTNIPGWKHAIAQSSRLQKGVLVFFFPTNVFNEIQVRAKGGEQQFQAMLLEIQREAANEIFDATRSKTLKSISSEYEKAEHESMTKILRLLAREDDTLADGFIEARHQGMTKNIRSESEKYASKIEGQIRRQISSTTCLVLDPYEGFAQQSHMILLFGSIQKQNPSISSQPRNMSRQLSMGLKIQAPCIIPLLDQQYTSDNSKAVLYLTGHQGAIIMVCPTGQGSDSFGYDIDESSLSYFGGSMPSLGEGSDQT